MDCFGHSSPARGISPRHPKHKLRRAGCLGASKDWRQEERWKHGWQPTPAGEQLPGLAHRQRGVATKVAYFRSAWATVRGSGVQCFLPLPAAPRRSLAQADELALGPKSSVVCRRGRVGRTAYGQCRKPATMHNKSLGEGHASNGLVAC